VDTIVGTAGSDTINAIIDNTTSAIASTFTVLDVIDGGTGADTLNLNVLNGAGGAGTPVTGLPAITLAGVETANIRAAIDLTADVSTTWAGVASINVTQGAAVSLTAAAASAVAISSSTGAIAVDGGNSVAVTDSTKDTDITIGATTVNAGNITVNATKAGATTIAIDGGMDITVNASGLNTTITANATDDNITIGQGGAASDLPSGIVAVSSAHVGVAGTDVNLNDIVITGGSTITVSQTADTSKAPVDTTGATLTQGDVTVAGGKTVSVSVSQAKSTAEVVGVTAVAGVTETASVKFAALGLGDTLILGGLTFTASASLRASEAAAAFSSLVNGKVPATGDTQSGGPASKGAYTGAFTGWTSGVASADTVVFTSTTANSNVTDLANLGTGTVTITTTSGSSATANKAGVLGVVNGTVLINDAATAAITTVSVDGYGASSKIGDAVTLSKLATLSLSNSGGATAGSTNASMTVDAAGVSSLVLTLNNVNGSVNLDGAADSSLTSLNVITAGTKSTSAVTAASVAALTVSGTAALDLTGSTLSALKTVSVIGAGGLTVDASGQTVTGVDASASTGANAITIDSTKANYTGGFGVDSVTTVAAAPSKAIALGDGNDKLTLVSGTTSVTGVFSGGGGEDTLSIVTADAVIAGGSSAFATAVTGFEVLTLTGSTGAQSVDLSALGGFQKATSSASAGTLTLNNFANGGTLTVTANTTGVGYIVAVKDAAVGTADVVKLVLSKAGALTTGTVTAANVETVTIAANDTTASVAAGTNTHTLVLSATAATSLVVTGNANLNLDNTGNTAVTSIDASAMTGALTVTTAGTIAETVKGGSGPDVLTAAAGTVADNLQGGGGEDTLTANSGLSILTGGAGNDLFAVVASLNVNGYATVTDFSSGDLIQLPGADSFQTSKVSLGDTAVFQDYANAAVNAVGPNDLAWFQFAGNTYVVMDSVGGAGIDSTIFVNGEDLIVRLTGLTDLSLASFNDTFDTIAL